MRHVRQGLLLRAATALIALSSASAVSVCAQAPAANPPASSTREIVDETGRAIRVPISPGRVVSLAPSLTETIYALGLQDHLVGDTDFCDYPPEAQKKPKVGGGINPNLEVIVALHPDLVLVTKSFNRLETVRALETLGIPSYSTDPHTVSEILSSTEKLADVLGFPDAGKAVKNDLESRLANLQAKLSGLRETRVLFVVWDEPLISVGKDTFIADALEKAGAHSVVESSQDWPQINLEEVVHLQPDYLVFAASHSEGGGHDFETLAVKPGWRLLDAVHYRRFAVISDAVNRPAPRLVSAIEDLARQLHPAAFEISPASQEELVPRERPSPANFAQQPSFHASRGDEGCAVDICVR